MRMIIAFRTKLHLQFSERFINDLLACYWNWVRNIFSIVAQHEIFPRLILIIGRVNTWVLRAVCFRIICIFIHNFAHLEFQILEFVFQISDDSIILSPCNISLQVLLSWFYLCSWWWSGHVSISHSTASWHHQLRCWAVSWNIGLNICFWVSAEA